MSILIDRDGPVLIVTINRAERRNAVDRYTADALADAFRGFDADENLSVAILTGAVIGDLDHAAGSEFIEHVVDFIDGCELLANPRHGTLAIDRYQHHAMARTKLVLAFVDFLAAGGCLDRNGTLEHWMSLMTFRHAGYRAG